MGDADARAGLAGDPAILPAASGGTGHRPCAGWRGGDWRAPGLGTADVEDVVQETLLAIHVKRRTWKTDQPFKPWLNAIARHKLIDVLRRRGRRGEVPIDGLEETLPDMQSPSGETSQGELTRLVARLDGKQLAVVRGISLDGESIAEAAARLGMSEGAVRVALHRGLRKLAALYGGAP